ncbi:MAG: phosphodiester glycosidase family protein [Candidatus Melainabacteria bacterium]|nr:phosphodiester glycosidase family protein [Candidatus Melainabacteria bacterium]
MKKLFFIFLLIGNLFFLPVQVLPDVDPPKYYFTKETKEYKPGIKRHLIRTITKKGPVVANVLEIDLSNENISVKVGLPDAKKIKAKETLLNIVKHEMAYLGINANYFDVKLGNPLGTLITEGTWLVGPVYDRVAIGFSKDKKAFVDQVMLVGNATTYRGFRRKPVTTFEIDGLNTPPHFYNKISLFTINWDEELVLPSSKTGVIVKNGCIKKIVNDRAEIPKKGYVLVSNANYVLNYLKRKDRLKIKWQSHPDWSNVVEAVSGGPYLIMNGEIYVDEINQKFKFAKKETYTARSAVGVDYNGKLYLIVVDSKDDNHSVGVTLQELAELLKKLNLKEAINLDGGGSSTLVVDGKIINKLSERHERKISSALLIFYHHF